MNTEFQEKTQEVVEQLRWIESEYQDVAADAFQFLETHDPETAKLALEAFEDRNAAAGWFGGRVESLGWKTPWECIAEGQTDEVQRILNAIIYGDPA